MSSLLEDWSSVLAAVLTCILYTCWRVLKYHLQHKQRLPFNGALPSPPHSHWFFGHIQYMRGGFPFFLDNMMVQHADTNTGLTAFWLFHKPAMSVLQYQDARAVLHAETYRKPIWLVRHHVTHFLGKRNIGILVGREWKNWRAAILRALHPQHVLSNYRPAMMQVTETLIQSVVQKQQREQQDDPTTTTFDVESLMKMITMDIFARTALSYDLQCCAKLQLSEMAHAFDFLSSELTRRLGHPLSITDILYILPTKRNRRYHREQQLLRNFLAELIDERRQRGRDTKTHPSSNTNDLLDSLMQATNEDMVSGDALSNQTLSDVLLSLLFAGYDTTSITLSYALYNLAQHPKAEATCLEEIERVWKKRRYMDPDDLHYCRAVLLETLRLYAPPFLISRNMTKPLELPYSGFVIPEGTIVFIPVYQIQRDPKHFARPNEFHPERWVMSKHDAGEQTVWQDRPSDEEQNDDDDGGTIPAANRQAFFAFSAGARSCAGQKFAMQEAVLILATLLKNLKFELLPGYQVVPLRNGLVQRPKGGLPMIVSTRK